MYNINIWTELKSIKARLYLTFKYIKYGHMGLSNTYFIMQPLFNITFMRKCRENSNGQNWFTCFPPQLFKRLLITMRNDNFTTTFPIVTYYIQYNGIWKKEWASSHTPRSNIDWECCIQWMAIPSIRDGQSDKKGI